MANRNEADVVDAWPNELAEQRDDRLIPSTKHGEKGLFLADMSFPSRFGATMTMSIMCHSHKKKLLTAC